jgi:hypothetical protein
LSPLDNRPISSKSQQNASAKKVQLSLDSFFARDPKEPKPRPIVLIDKSKPRPKTVESPKEVDGSDISVNFDCNKIFELSDDDDVRPLKKRKADVTEKSKSSQKPRARNVQKKIASTTPRVSRHAADQSDLPPISSIYSMFDDLVARAGKLGDLVDRLNGRKLRVATMCSGTESPLLGLRMITRSLFEQTGKKLEIEHIFSCEIEPFKQAYIERNFSPPILFRDVLELANDYAY